MEVEREGGFEPASPREPATGNHRATTKPRETLGQCPSPHTHPHLNRVRQRRLCSSMVTEDSRVAHALAARAKLVLPESQRRT